ncbi:MAG: hypothetical protein DLM72_09305 [Candidatus Nitrosopolaris wilkensis]|nr:MAG: hypothetical protein DLM72_09305 [Candidatus Nitrosopolaris wilkensis]
MINSIIISFKRCYFESPSCFRFQYVTYAFVRLLLTSENDRIIPPAVEQMFAKQMNASTISLHSGHASLVSHPNEIAQLILNATKGVTK